MVTILHGESLTQSRTKLNELLTQAKASQRQIIRLEAKKLDLALLEETFGSTSLFNEPQTIVIEELHSLPKSAKKETLIKSLAAFLTSPSSSDIAVILWEKRALTSTMLKPFKDATVFEFKLSSFLFKWLDALSNNPKTKTQQLKLFHQALEQEDEFLCFVMLTRQIRLLIQARSGGVVKGAPFMVEKLRKQAQVFSLDALLKLHHQLLEIDIKTKTTRQALSFRNQLDLFLLSM